jgi:hypothetical protein
MMFSITSKLTEKQAKLFQHPGGLMRLIAISIVILAGAVMASAGVIANTVPATIFGVALMGIASLLFIVEWWPVPSQARHAGVPSAAAAKTA